MNGAQGMGLWKGISSHLGMFKNGIAMDIGRGNDNLFWFDRWCCSRSLMEEVPILFNLATNKQASVVDYWNDDVVPNSWNIQLRHHLNDWEVVQMARLIGFVEHWHPITGKDDGRRWIPGINGAFFVKFSYSFLRRQEEFDFRWDGIWKIGMPSTVLFFMWTALKNRIPTIDLLQKRGLILPNVSSLSRRCRIGGPYSFALSICEGSMVLYSLGS